MILVKEGANALRDAKFTTISTYGGSLVKCFRTKPLEHYQKLNYRDTCSCNSIRNRDLEEENKVNASPTQSVLNGPVEMHVEEGLTVRFEGLIWFVVGGLILFASLDLLIRNINESPELIPVGSYLLGFVAFSVMGIGILLMINEISKAVASKK